MGIKHSNSNLGSHLKTFSNFYFMSQSEVIYLLQLDEIYYSGFSKYTAILGNKK